MPLQTSPMFLFYTFTFLLGVMRACSSYLCVMYVRNVRNLFISLFFSQFVVNIITFSPWFRILPSYDSMQCLFVMSLLYITQYSSIRESLIILHGCNIGGSKREWRRKKYNDGVKKCKLYFCIHHCTHMSCTQLHPNRADVTFFCMLLAPLAFIL